MVNVNRSAPHGSARLIGCGRAERLHQRRRRTPVARQTARVFFSVRGTQHVKTYVAGDWVAGAAMLLAAASWGLLAALLGS
jgi:hypothetical protein